VATEDALPPAGGVTVLGENATCTPPGNAPSIVRSTGELKPPIDVTVTVFAAEPPALTLRLPELSDIEKSAPEVIVKVKLVVRVGPPVPLTVIILLPVGALPPTLMVRVLEAVPPEGMEMGFGLNPKVTPDGVGPVTDNVTAPEKPSIEVPVIERVPDVP